MGKHRSQDSNSELSSRAQPGMTATCTRVSLPSRSWRVDVRLPHAGSLSLSAFPSSGLSVRCKNSRLGALYICVDPVSRLPC